MTSASKASCKVDAIKEMMAMVRAIPSPGSISLKVLG
jgi:hypothetical protein